MDVCFSRPWLLRCLTQLAMLMMPLVMPVISVHPVPLWVRRPRVHHGLDTDSSWRPDRAVPVVRLILVFLCLQPCQHLLVCRLLLDDPVLLQHQDFQVVPVFLLVQLVLGRLCRLALLCRPL